MQFQHARLLQVTNRAGHRATTDAGALSDLHDSDIRIEGYRDQHEPVRARQGPRPPRDAVEISGTGDMSVNFVPYLKIPLSAGIRLVG